MERGGPLLYHYIIQIIQSTTEDSIRAMTLRVTKMKITDFQGENIGKVTSQLRSALIRLKTTNNLPPNITNKIFKIFQTRCIDNFNEVCRAMKMLTRLQGLNYTTKTILKQA